MINKTVKEELIDKLASIQANVVQAQNMLYTATTMQSELGDYISSLTEYVEDEPEPEPSESVIWNCGFETGDLSEVNKVGGVVLQGSTRASVGVTSGLVAHSGDYCARLMINTPTTASTAAYLFYWKDNLPQQVTFESWYLIPGEVVPGAWWIIQQIKSTPEGMSTNYSKPIYILGVNSANKFYLTWRPDLDDATKKTYVSSVQAPRDQWFKIEMYVRQSTGADGQIIIYINDIEILNVTGNPTMLSDLPLMWSICNYAEKITPVPCVIYVDDITIRGVV